jgi:hypothetical protein
VYLILGAERISVLLDLRGLPFLEEAQRFCSDGQLSAASRKDPSQPPEFLKSPHFPVYGRGFQESADTRLDKKIRGDLKSAPV